MRKKSDGGMRMLVLSRRRSESLRIGDDVTVTILSLDRYQVRVGIDAPKNIAVHREEIYECIRAEQLAKARQPTD